MLNFDNTRTVESRIVTDPYLALQVCFDEEEHLLRHAGFYKGDANLFEIGTDYYTNELKKAVLVLCDEFERAKAPIEIPSCAEGALTLEPPRRTECNCFKTTIYDDGVRIRLSTSSATTHYRCDKVTLGFSEDDGLVEVFVGKMPPEAIDQMELLLREAVSQRNLDPEADNPA